MTKGDETASGEGDPIKTDPLRLGSVWSRLRPIDTDKTLARLRRAFGHALPRGWSVVGDLPARGDYDGWLVEHAGTGRLALWTSRGVLRGVEQRPAAKALAALRAAESAQQDEPHQGETADR